MHKIQLVHLILGYSNCNKNYIRFSRTNHSILKYFLERNINMHFGKDEFIQVFYDENYDCHGEIEYKFENDNLNICLNNEMYVIHQEVDQLVMKTVDGQVLFRIYLTENTMNNVLIQESDGERNFEYQKVGLEDEFYEYHKTTVTSEKRVTSKTLRTIPKYGKKHIHFKIKSLEEDGTINTFWQNRKYPNIKIEKQENVYGRFYLEEVFNTLEEQSIKDTCSRKFAPSF